MLFNALAHFIVARLGGGHKEHLFPAQFARQLLGKGALAAARSAQDQDQASHRRIYPRPPKWYVSFRRVSVTPLL
jgi:hypothetical protein